MATILTLYGVITVGGPALHALPGFGHGSAGVTSEESKAPVRADQESASPDDCPICHFHAQGQVIADPDACASIEVVRILPAADPPVALPPAVDRPSIPRAPPLI